LLAVEFPNDFHAPGRLAAVGRPYIYIVACPLPRPPCQSPPPAGNTRLVPARTCQTNCVLPLINAVRDRQLTVASFIGCANHVRCGLFYTYRAVYIVGAPIL
jgi:hypothetical protein